MRVRAVWTIRVNPCNIQLNTSQSCTQSLLPFWTSTRLWVPDGTQFVYALTFELVSKTLYPPPPATDAHTYIRSLRPNLSF